MCPDPHRKEGSMATSKRKRLKARADSEITMKDLMAQFIDEKKADGRSPKTLESYQGSFNKFLNIVGNNTTLGEIDRGTVIHFKHAMEKEELSVASTNHYLRDIRTLFNWLHSLNYLPKIEVTMIKGQEEAVKVYTDEEIQLLLEKPRKSDGFVEWRTWAIVNWILGTGNRIETVVNILIGDVYFGKGEIILREQKNKKATIIPMDRTLSFVLKEYIKMWRADATDRDFLFCNQYGEPLTTKALQHSLANYNRRRGVEKTSAHALRHTFSRLFVLNSGGDVFRLQKILGHSTLDMTRHYVNLFDADLKKGFDDISPLSSIAKNRGTRRKTIRKSED